MFAPPGPTPRFWRQNPKQQLAALAAAVKGKRVIEIGCADGSLARFMLDAGAAQVTGYDCGKEECRFTHPRFTYNPEGVCFDTDISDCDLHVLSWPTQIFNLARAITPSLALHRKPVVLLGCNTPSKTICGSAYLWAHVCGRDLIGYQEDAKGRFFAHYGAGVRDGRTSPVFEALGALYAFDEETYIGDASLTGPPLAELARLGIDRETISSVLLPSIHTKPTSNEPHHVR